MVVSPDGLMLPCLLAHTLPGFTFWNVKDRPLGEIWSSSPGLQAFRGASWMPQPCRSCERRAIDSGGCRCQADPVCSLSPDHGLVEAARADATQRTSGVVALTYRTREASREKAAAGLSAARPAPGA